MTGEFLTFLEKFDNKVRLAFPSTIHLNPGQDVIGDNVGQMKRGEFLFPVDFSLTLQLLSFFNSLGTISGTALSG